MKLRTPLAIVALSAAVLAGMALPAAADDTDTTFTLTGGDMTLSVQPTAALTDVATGSTAVSGNLGTVAVTDERGGTVTWSVAAVSTTFTGVRGSTSTAVTYTGGTVAETGTITVADGALTSIDAQAPVVAPTSLSGNNTASWSPTLVVTMPAGALADDYSGTVTTSAL